MTGATGRVALVTGASSGIGATTARLPAARGMRVVVNYLGNNKAAEEVVSDIEAVGGQAMAVQADVREVAAIESMVQQVRAAWGGIIAPHFTTDGQADVKVGGTAITAVAAELGVPATVTAAEIYRTGTTTPY
jgi:NAD(P)-dependent dehydrogenase (short-subunit alcohol dehydrogenase family)